MNGPKSSYAGCGVPTYQAKDHLPPQLIVGCLHPFGGRLLYRQLSHADDSIRLGTRSTYEENGSRPSSHQGSRRTQQVLAPIRRPLRIILSCLIMKPFSRLSHGPAKVPR